MGGADDIPRRDFWNEPDSVEDRAGLALRLRRLGIRDLRVLRAMERVPRRLFLSSKYQKQAYRDQALPIDCGQTVSAPHLVGLMTSALDIRGSHKVLEIGTGSGYQAAVLSQLAGEVYTVERYQTLMKLARQRFESLRLKNIYCRMSDGFLGWPDKAPFDRIVVTAAAPKIPEALTDQLKLDGIMVIPVGPPGGVQALYKVTRENTVFSTNKIADVRFVSMVAGVAGIL